MHSLIAPLLSLPPAGILYALLHVPDLVAAVPGGQRDLQAALQYVLTQECDAEGRPGKGQRGRAEGRPGKGQRGRGGQARSCTRPADKAGLVRFRSLREVM